MFMPISHNDISSYSLVSNCEEGIKREGNMAKGEVRHGFADSNSENLREEHFYERSAREQRRSNRRHRSGSRRWGHGMSSVRDSASHDVSAETRTGSGISSGLVLLLAVTVGAAVANRFYIEPLLSLVARTLHVSTVASGLLVTFAQVGYVLGLVLLVPLGDLLERRRLVSVMLLAAGLAAIGCAAAPNLPVLAVALFALGLLSVTAQILIPLAATLAAPEERGRVVGIVTSGLLIGVLAARTASGVAADFGGFRLIFAFAAIAMLTLSILLWRRLPAGAPTEEGGYPSLLRSIWTLIAEEPVLRQRMALAFLHMACFSVLWTPSAFLLSGPPYHYNTMIIGLFGLAGIAGALAAPLAGRLGDRGYGRLAVTGSLLVMLASWGLLAIGGSSLVALIAGIALLDLGVQGAHINHQRTIYALRPDARSRLNTAYMVAFFFGGVLGSLLAVMVYGSYGWLGDCILGAVLALIALLIWGGTRNVGSPRGRHSPTAGTRPHRVSS
jgi:predicted MFS family arabinose efflux permease